MRCALAVLMVLTFLGAPVLAEQFYVDNVLGNDAFDGRSPQVVNTFSGPMRSISKALAVVGPGDVLHLANTGRPYRQPISLTGVRFRGTPLMPFLLAGNGAVVDGSRPIPPHAWQQIERGLWRVTPGRKGFYLLLEGEQPLPEVPAPNGQLPELPEKHWCALRGAIYLRTGIAIDPPEMDLRLAGETAGLTLFDVRYVIVENLTLRHWRVDGVNVHDLCRDVVLRNVTSVENGRAGIAVSGSSLVVLEKPTVRDNRKYSILVTEKGGVQVDDTTNVTPEPTEKTEPRP